MDLLRQTLMKQMISTIHKNASIAAPATGTIQVQDRSAVIKPTMTCAIVIISCCLMWLDVEAQILGVVGALGEQGDDDADEAQRIDSQRENLVVMNLFLAEFVGVVKGIRCRSRSRRLIWRLLGLLLGLLRSRRLYRRSA